MPNGPTDTGSRTPARGDGLAYDGPRPIGNGTRPGLGAGDQAVRTAVRAGRRHPPRSARAAGGTGPHGRPEGTTVGTAVDRTSARTAVDRTTVRTGGRNAARATRPAVRAMVRTGNGPQPLVRTGSGMHPAAAGAHNGPQPAAGRVPARPGPRRSVRAGDPSVPAVRPCRSVPVRAGDCPYRRPAVTSGAPRGGLALAVDRIAGVRAPPARTPAGGGRRRRGGKAPPTATRW